MRSRSLTGKPARQLRTEWTDAWERHDSPGYLPMPLQFMLVSDAYSRISRVAGPRAHRHARRSGRRHDGRGAAVRDVMFDLVEEYVTATERIAQVSAG